MIKDDPRIKKLAEDLAKWEADRNKLGDAVENLKRAITNALENDFRMAAEAIKIFYKYMRSIRDGEYKKNNSWGNLS